MGFFSILISVECQLPGLFLSLCVSVETPNPPLLCPTYLLTPTPQRRNVGQHAHMNPPNHPRIPKP